MYCQDPEGKIVMYFPTVEPLIHTIFDIYETVCSLGSPQLAGIKILVTILY